MSGDGNTKRERLRRTFDLAAGSYQEARPPYPAALFDTVVSLSGLRAADVLCEVGPASGKATVEFARRGFAVVGVELGASLAAEARRNLAEFPRVSVVHADFETWQPAGGGFGLVYAATAWRWVDPAVRYAKAASLLRHGGHLAFWDALHVLPETGGDPFFREIQDVYDSVGAGAPGGSDFPTTEDLPDLTGEIEASGLFGSVAVRRFTWEIQYSAAAYIRLLDTFSSHISMAPWQRDRLYREIRRRLALRPDGMLRRHWGAVLHVARRN